MGTNCSQIPNSDMSDMEEENLSVETVPEDKAKVEVKAKMKSLHVESEIKYRYARTVVTSTVLNTADKAEEIFFHVILPESAFISEFQMEIEGNTYKAQVKEKQEAKAEYSAAVASGKTAGHVAYTVRDSNKFTVSVNVESNKEVIFKLTYEELLKRELSAYKHCVNIDPGQIVEDLKVQVTISESSSITRLEVPPLHENKELTAEPVKTDDSLVKIERPGPAKAVIHWAPTVEEQEKLNKSGVRGQLVVRYDVDRLSKPEQVLINNGYFVHFFAPSNLPPMRKHVTFVLDVSRSMHGQKLQQLKEAMNTILSDMNEDEFFSIVIFSTYVYVWDPAGTQQIPDGWNDDNYIEVEAQLADTTVVPASPANIQKAKDFINKLRVYWCTDIYDALLKGIQLISLGKALNATSEQIPESMIIFLTDGQANGIINDTEQIVNEVTTYSVDVGAAIYSLGFGGDADMDLLRKLSLKNSGFARKIYEASDATLQLKNFYFKISSPLLSNVKFSYQDDKVDAASITKSSFPRLFNGSELVIAGRVHGKELKGELVSHSRKGSHVRAITSPDDVVPEEADFMERMWAYLTIKQLLDSVTAVESEESATIKKKALELALKYSFVTSLTSLVVVKPDNKELDVGTRRADEVPDDTPVKTPPPSAQSVVVGRVLVHLFGPSVLLTEALSRSTLKRTAQDAALPEESIVPAKLRALFTEESIVPVKHRAVSTGTGTVPYVVMLKKNPAAMSMANGLFISRVEFVSNIQCQRATTNIVMEVRNPKNDLVQGDFQIPVRSGAVIVGCVLEADGDTITAHSKSKDEIAREIMFHTNNAVLISRIEGQEGICVTLRLVKNKTVNIKITYEELLPLTDQHCTFVLPSNIVANKISATICIQCSDVGDVNGFFDNAKDVVLPDIDTSSPDKAVVSWTVDVAKQEELRSVGSSGKFSLTFKVANDYPDVKLACPRIMEALCGDCGLACVSQSRSQDYSLSPPSRAVYRGPFNLSTFIFRSRDSLVTPATSLLALQWN